jgi:phosphatidylserine/phosphatidylglycerophosphate/cardiolipin synthase-like enzyme
VVGTVADEPRYWGSWKGRVVKAIAIDRIQSWIEIKEATGLSKAALNRVLKELYDVDAIYQNPKGTYWVEKDLYDQYSDYFKSQPEPKAEKVPKFEERNQENLVRYIDEWKGLKKLDIDLRNRHFFLAERFLDELSKDLITESKSEVLIVNPYVEKCALSDTMREAAGKVDVTLLTRPPQMDREEYQERKREYHGHLKQDGVRVVYNKDVHAKITIVDRAVAVVSSMNFNPRSSGGASWEVGVVTIDKAVVDGILDAVWKVLDKPESKG